MVPKENSELNNIEGGLCCFMQYANSACHHASILKRKNCRLLCLPIRRNHDSRHVSHQAGTRADRGWFYSKARMHSSSCAMPEQLTMGTAVTLCRAKYRRVSRVTSAAVSSDCS